MHRLRETPKSDSGGTDQKGTFPMSDKARTVSERAVRKASRERLLRDMARAKRVTFTVSRVVVSTESYRVEAVNRQDAINRVMVECVEGRQPRGEEQNGVMWIGAATTTQWSGGAV